ncbi:probable transcriptional regulatory protein TTE1135 isoform X2 [Bradysia coprophila]|uniref:probable transcriptional regulatory protein TTE1135 isoform X2 n=1 Tax=Bradysia coprophila TaxID=38358 RepID=UPI00187DAA42|nr:probable transcriptional regulatory protein TTE1135 isoform X2 [Bradysia coprophila]
MFVCLLLECQSYTVTTCPGRAMLKLTQLLSKPNCYFVYKNSAVELHTTLSVPAGHSKWANIKHIKGLKDGQRSLEFTRQARNIKLAVQEGGGSTNPALNSLLRTAIEAASKKNMPGASIQAVLKRCSGQNMNVKKSILGIRQGKVFLVVILYTDNLIMAKNQLNTLLRKSAAACTDTVHMFDNKGIIEVVGNEKLDAKTPDELEEIATEHAIECGAEELEVIDANTRHLTFICDPDEMERVKQKLSAMGYNVEFSEHVFIPNNPITLSQAEQEVYDKFKDKLKTYDGVDSIYDNLNIED